MILGHELKLERSLIVPRDCLEHRLMWVGNDDSPQQSCIRCLVQSPIKYWFQSDGEHLLRQPAGDRVEPGTQSPTWDHCRVEDHERIGVIKESGSRGRTWVSCTLTFGGSSVSEASPGPEGE